MRKRMEGYMAFFTIRKKLVLILVGLPLIPLFVFSLYFLGNIKTDAVQSFVSSTNRELRHVDKSFAFFMDGMKDTVKLLATTPELHESYEQFPDYTKTTTASNLPEESLAPAVRQALKEVFSLPCWRFLRGMIQGKETGISWQKREGILL